jgi:NAD+--dinitrogen-reductase ADP-D-ribosyltransferase
MFVGTTIATAVPALENSHKPLNLLLLFFVFYCADEYDLLQRPVFCVINYKDMDDNLPHSPPLPGHAKLLINRCNLPASILGSATFQRHPTALTIDGVLPLHNTLFNELKCFDSHEDRARLFTTYMKAHFTLDELDEAGFDKGSRIDRSRANYLTLLRGWFFDPDGREGAVLKGWVESRFGLIPRYHQGKINDPDDMNYLHYLTERCAGLYNTNALEAQIDLLYSYCQYELAHHHQKQSHLTLYRGTNDFRHYEVLQQTDKHSATVLLNSINSFSRDRETASQFGDTVMSAHVPLSKILFFGGLLPGFTMSEMEFAVIGGIYSVDLLDTLC